MRSIVLSSILTLAFALGTVSVVHAAPPPPAPLPAASDMYTNPVTYGGVDTVPKFLLALVDLVFLIAVPIIVICIIYAGFLFVTAGDNQTQIGKAKTVFTWTVIGAGVLLGAKAIELAIQSTICSLDANYTSYFCP
jgi:hypothetical protein